MVRSRVTYFRASGKLERDALIEILSSLRPAPNALAPMTDR